LTHPYRTEAENLTVEYCITASSVPTYAVRRRDPDDFIMR
jgi:hypothetical protein